MFLVEVDHILLDTFGARVHAGGVNLDARIEKGLLNIGESAEPVVALNQASVLWPRQGPPELLSELQQALAAIRENSQLDMVRAERDRAEGEQVDLFGCQFGEHL